MFEHHSKPLISASAFMGRMAGQLLLTLLLTLSSLALGVAGYVAFEGLGMVDAFLNAAMLLGGMGEITELHTTGGKIFAGIYALYSGFYLILCGGLLLVPVFHRLLHYFHQR